MSNFYWNTKIPWKTCKCGQPYLNKCPICNWKKKTDVTWGPSEEKRAKEGHFRPNDSYLDEVEDKYDAEIIE